MAHGITTTFNAANRCLIVHATNLEHGLVEPTLPEELEDVFSVLAPFFTERRQELVIRDFRDHTIDDRHPDGSLEGINLLRVGVPAWPADDSALTYTVAYFLHLMARWQHFDLPYTLGEELAAVGMATLFAEEYSNWTPPWITGTLPPGIYRRAGKDWENKDYAYNDWFNPQDSDNLGYLLAKELSSRYLDGPFVLRESIKTTAAELRPLF